ncbi:hypothetical protein [Polyangium sorediatum]|uniref:Uncharacterized protein n=1 Tax=Polyangium sorediatum TaxID=889274 RepID=A0ABT6NPF3_9BACT|nr:hypothetical protein [Polyangium sorediatum]MDI1430188.1 hypothetical protein [Polyangium sorediatum]
MQFSIRPAAQSLLRASTLEPMGLLSPGATWRDVMQSRSHVTRGLRAPSKVPSLWLPM